MFGLLIAYDLICSPNSALPTYLSYLLYLFFADFAYINVGVSTVKTLKSPCDSTPLPSGIA